MLELQQGSVMQGFLKSLGVIFASEIGDKTFFIAAIMAMQHPRLLARRLRCLCG
jgi:Ca2+/H+ antiporter, TMEM165/GDT1 family